MPDIRVTVTQKGLQEYYSTLTENVTLDNLVNAKVSVSPTQSWDPETGASWMLEFWTDGVEPTGDIYNPYSGTGTYISLDMRSEPIFFNDDSEYYMTDGEYTVTEYDGNVPPMHIAGGIPGYYDWQHPGSWVFVVEDGVVKGAGPLAAGTITVSRDGDRYTFRLRLSGRFRVYDDGNLCAGVRSEMFFHTYRPAYNAGSIGFRTGMWCGPGGFRRAFHMLRPVSLSAGRGI